MSLEVHILTQNYLSEDFLIPIIKSAADKSNLHFKKSTDCYIAAEQDFTNQLEFYINAIKDYHDSLGPLYYPGIPGYGANIIIAYYHGDNVLAAFLHQFLKNVPDAKVYVGEDLPQGVDYYLYSKEDFEDIKTIDTHEFIQKPPKQWPAKI